MGTIKATNEELIDRVEECYAAGETVDAGGVVPETVAEALPITSSQAAKRLAKLANEGELERDYGLDGRFNHRIGFAPVSEDEPEEPRLIADGGTDNSHAGVVARQLAEADEETLEEIGAEEDDR